MTSKPTIVIFRQTLNVTWKRWEAPKRLTTIEEITVDDGSISTKEVWRRIDNVDTLIDSKHGIGLALWRLEKRMNALRDKEKRLIWKATISDRKRTTIGKNTYSVWTLTCARRKYDMSGAN